MRTRLFLPALAATAIGHVSALAQTATLRPFRSDHELAVYLRRLSTPCTGSVTVTSDTGVTTVSGRVTRGTNRALESAQVLATGIPSATQTGSDGRYTLDLASAHLQPGDSITIVARRLGYTARQQRIVWRSGAAFAVDFSLCPTRMQLSEVVVGGYADATSSAVRASPSPSQSLARRQVTNVQEAGVDEGDIVKLHGDYLVVLRRGRLFTVHVGRRAPEPVVALDAFGPGINAASTWYDEILVSDDRVIVVGYSYERGGTEVGVFQIDSSGHLAYRATYQLRSNDYYSSRNYASRLIGHTLIFYAPLYLRPGLEDPLTALPAMRRWRAGELAGFRRIATVERIYRPVGQWDAAENVALHTVTACDLAAEEMTCEATVVVGPAGRVFYVSPSAVYVWTGSSMLVRMPLDRSAPAAVGVSGTPIDQFSFLESGDGYVNVLLRPEGNGDAMWGSERPGDRVALLRLPLTSFGDGSQVVASWRYRPLPATDGYVFQNRFVGDYVLYGTGNGWGTQMANHSTLVVTPWRGGDAIEIALPHGTDRIEAMGADAVIIGADGRDLHLSAIHLPRGTTDSVRLAQRFTFAQASQGELRSHGFFYRADGPDAGVIGLPVRGPARPGYSHLAEGSAGVLFVRNTGHDFTELGTLAASDASPSDDACRASCVDWYGNARPLFVDDRIFALLGYELVEGRVRGGSIHDSGRVSFAPPIAGFAGH